MPQDRVPPVPVAGSTVPEKDVTESPVQHSPSTPKAALTLKEEVPEKEPKAKAKAKVPTSMINAHT
eukprot:6460197-Amphidinium_carterae.1